MEQQSKFSPGQMLTTTRYIPPLPKGSTVTLMRVEIHEEDMEYLIVGHQAIGRSIVEMWVRERDIKACMIV
jgi:hypothetical protein